MRLIGILMFPLVFDCVGAKPLEFSIINNFGNSIFPSCEVSTATIPARQRLGRHLQAMVVRVSPPAGKAAISIVVSSARYLHESRTDTVTSGAGFIVIPLNLVWNFDQLLSVTQPQPENFLFRIWMDGKLVNERTLTYQVRSINDCLLSWREPAGRNHFNTSEMYAAYVNENNPAIDKIIQQVVKRKLVQSVSRNTHDRERLLNEMGAIWTVLQSLGVKYTSITRESVLSSGVSAQHVRLLSDALSDSGANCVDGSVLIASIFTKLGWGEPFLVSIPGHCYMGVDLVQDAHQIICVETTMIGSKADFRAANRKGDAEYQRDLPHIRAKEPGYDMLPEN